MTLTVISTDTDMSYYITGFSDIMREMYTIDWSSEFIHILHLDIGRNFINIKGNTNIGLSMGVRCNGIEKNTEIKNIDIGIQKFAEFFEYFTN